MDRSNIAVPSIYKEVHDLFLYLVLKLEFLCPNSTGPSKAAIQLEFLLCQLPINALDCVHKCTLAFREVTRYGLG